MLIFGLTGGLGSGKSEAARRFRAKGIPVIDADALGHRVLAPGGAAEAAVKSRFGDAIQSNGIIDRQKLGLLVFADPTARHTLNTLVHPRIYEAILAECAALEAAERGVVLVEAALWGEDGTLPAWMDGLILVECSEAARRERVMRSRGLSEDEVQRRIEAQAPPEAKRSLADFVILNTADIPALEAEVDRLAEVLHARAEKR